MHVLDDAGVATGIDLYALLEVSHGSPPSSATNCRAVWAWRARVSTLRLVPVACRGVCTIVIGAGMAGLTAAAHLASSGHDVTVVEKGTVPGGRLASESSAGAVCDEGAEFFTACTEAFTAAVDALVCRRTRVRTVPRLCDGRRLPVRRGAW